MSIQAVISTADAIRILSEGGVVGVPTETVYGLAAVASNELAVARIFETKQRPADNPLIVHVASIEQANDVGLVTQPMQRLMEAWWPGPLTIVMEHRSGVCRLARAGLDTVAVRLPDHPTLLDIINGVGTPLVAPSANLSGRPSPTLAQHVVNDFSGTVPVVDGGPCRIGLESTVVRVAGNTVSVLRPGFVTAENLEHLGFEIVASPNELHLAPGTRHRHYAPNAHVRLFYDKRLLMEAAEGFEEALILAREKPPTNHEWRKLDGSTLYAELRRADTLGIKEILVHCDQAVCLDAALMDRLQRAAELGTHNKGS